MQAEKASSYAALEEKVLDFLEELQTLKNQVWFIERKSNVW